MASYKSASKILTGVHAAAVFPGNPLGAMEQVRNVKLVAKAGAAAYVSFQGQPSAGAFPIPNIPADGAFHTLDIEIANMGVLWITGSGDVYWIAELD